MPSSFALLFRPPGHTVEASEHFTVVDSVFLDAAAPDHYHIRLDCHASGFGEIRLWHASQARVLMTIYAEGPGAYVGMTTEPAYVGPVPDHLEIQVRGANQLFVGPMRLHFEPVAPTVVKAVDVRKPKPEPLSLRTIWQRRLSDDLDD
jgi:hypothetical protein